MADVLMEEKASTGRSHYTNNDYGKGLATHSSRPMKPLVEITIPPPTKTARPITPPKLARWALRPVATVLVVGGLMSIRAVLACGVQPVDAWSFDTSTSPTG